MAYVALARKWRPKRFDEIVGQEHVVRTLTHALEHDRLHHAYLFTGTRGVGKTTVARILAKAMNCEDRQKAEPCGICASCKDFDSGRLVDLIEVDAASKTKVEDTRELLENILYAPSLGRFKIYLIDEVHMLSSHSFNALLKTLEEPPHHVKFLLATTDPQKIPVTVLSRCLQFNLKRLTQLQIAEQMAKILNREGLEFEMSGVRSLARAADGSLRDGLSLMDQAIAHGAGVLSEAMVDSMLGTLPREPLFLLLQSLARGNAKEVVQCLQTLESHSPDYRDVLQHLLVILHHVALAQWAPEALKVEDDSADILLLAKALSADEVHLFYQIGLIGQRDLPLAPDPRSGFEMVVLRMLSFMPDPTVSVGQVEQPKSSMPQPELAPVTQMESLLHQDSSVPRSGASQSSPKTSEGKSTLKVPQPEQWPQFIERMGLTAMTRELANNCILVSFLDGVCVLNLNVRLGHLRTPRVESALKRALDDALGQEIRLTIHLTEGEGGGETPAHQKIKRDENRQQQAEDSIRNDPNVQTLIELFDAQVLPGTIKPH